MARRNGLRARGVARAITWVVALVPAVMLGLAGACTEQRGSLGEQCLKNQDCVSGVCAALKCTAPYPLLDASYVPPGDAALDANPEAAGGDDVTVVVPDDATAAPDAVDETGMSPPDVGTTGPGDATEDVVDEEHPDAPTDGSPDARAADAGEAG